MRTLYPGGTSKKTDTIDAELEATVVLGSSFDAHAVELRAKHADADMHGTAQMSDLTNVLNELAHRFQEFDDLTVQLNEVGRSVANSVLRSTRRLELEALHAGRVSIPRTKPLLHSRFLRPGHQCRERIVSWPAS